MLEQAAAASCANAAPDVSGTTAARVAAGVAADIALFMSGPSKNVSAVLRAVPNINNVPGGCSSSLREKFHY